MARTRSNITTDHDEIRNWAEERGASPACVKRTGRDGDVGMIRLDFPGFSGEGSLEKISWDEWFEAFDKNGLALLYQESTAKGQKSNFNKLISRETAQAQQKAKGSGRSARSSRVPILRSSDSRATASGKRSLRSASTPNPQSRGARSSGQSRTVRASSSSRSTSGRSRSGAPNRSRSAGASRGSRSTDRNASSPRAASAKRNARSAGSRTGAQSRSKRNAQSRTSKGTQSRSKSGRSQSSQKKSLPSRAGRMIAKAGQKISRAGRELVGGIRRKRAP
jgi:hypothetical protein